MDIITQTHLSLCAWSGGRGLYKGHNPLRELIGN